MHIPHYDIMSPVTRKWVMYDDGVLCFEVVWPKPLPASSGGGGGLTLTTAELPCGVVEEDPDMAQVVTDDWAACLQQVQAQAEQQAQNHERMMAELQARLAQSEQARIAAEHRTEAQTQEYLREQQRLFQQIEREGETQRAVIIAAVRRQQDLERIARQRAFSLKPPPDESKKKTPDAPRNLGSINPVPPGTIDVLRNVAANKVAQLGISWAIDKVTGGFKKKRKKK